ncbi:hypothetical protein SARC_08030 [Sphaeroforma arctica JP610]|uniref:Uncharacterized protein n=1 Tax=Sphaeroforma arctica JP610 TaxID=667725 RepID=A0A0L0FS24_9EUKA|nr:hypothetical protein SARC_08030 [Sphaeroforma arctica JP610]KNC79582.1 hypothetical protein SARC_08030 [Sphaeroforma arctica JP610]|eukprot:XP_014153484.1 hypothetical protein SARC_08030 [Sphaeroforma arctica JP610]
MAGLFDADIMSGSNGYMVPVAIVVSISVFTVLFIIRKLSSTAAVKESESEATSTMSTEQPVVAASEVPTPTTTVTQASPQVKSKAQQHRQRTSMALDDIPVHDKK